MVGSLSLKDPMAVTVLFCCWTRIEITTLRNQNQYQCFKAHRHARTYRYMFWGALTATKGVAHQSSATFQLHVKYPIGNTDVENAAINTINRTLVSFTQFMQWSCWDTNIPHTCRIHDTIVSISKAHLHMCNVNNRIWFSTALQSAPDCNGFLTTSTFPFWIQSQSNVSPS